MSVNNGNDLIAHVNVDCHCASCKPPTQSNMPPDVYWDNVISLTASRKSLERAKQENVNKAVFKYPMLECS